MHLQVMQQMMEVACFQLEDTYQEMQFDNTSTFYFFFPRLRPLLKPWGRSAATHLHPRLSSPNRIRWRSSSPPTATAPTKASLSASGPEVLTKYLHLHATDMETKCCWLRRSLLTLLFKLQGRCVRQWWPSTPQPPPRKQTISRVRLWWSSVRRDMLSMQWVQCHRVLFTCNNHPSYLAYLASSFHILSNCWLLKFIDWML